MINWNEHFDKIYCLSLSDYTDRRKDVTAEFERIGLDTRSDIFEWKYTVRNHFYQYMWNNPAFNIDMWWRNNISALNATMGHYEILKEAEAFGYDRILVLEDDVRFLKDVDQIHNTIRNTPEADVCNYAGNVNSRFRELSEYLKRTSDSEYYNTNDVVLIGMECISFSKQAIKDIVRLQEMKFQPADWYINQLNGLNEESILGHNLTRIAPVKQIALQNAAYRYNEPGYNYRIESIYGNTVNFDDFNITL